VEGLFAVGRKPVCGCVAFGFLGAVFLVSGFSFSVPVLGARILRILRSRCRCRCQDTQDTQTGYADSILRLPILRLSGSKLPGSQSPVPVSSASFLGADSSQFRIQTVRFQRLRAEGGTQRLAGPPPPFPVPAFTCLYRCQDTSDTPGWMLEAPRSSGGS
jgi:hypothetical protein